MAKHDDLAPRPSKAAIAGHPIHPMLIPFPVAMLFLVAASDIAYAVGAGVFWAKASYYMLWAGIIGGGIAAVAGLVDFIGIRRARSHRQGWFHVLAMLGVMAIAVVNLLSRLDDYAVAVVPSGLILSVVGAGLLLIGAWFGGELAYRHQIGVAGHARALDRKAKPEQLAVPKRATQPPAQAAKQRGPGLEQPTSI